jgi:flagellar FliL protein
VSTKKAKKEAPDGEDAAKGGKKKLLIIGLVAVLAIGAAAYFFIFSGSSSAEAEPAPEAGTIFTVEPVAINLAGGSYLKLGLALQYTAEYDAGGGHGAPVYDGAQALDLAIAQFSGASLADVQTNREAMKAALQESVVHAYHGAVMAIYITEYVTQ